MNASKTAEKRQKERS